MKATAILSLLVLLALPAIAQLPQPDIDDHHVLLVPVFAFSPGAHGSQWETSVSIASIEEDATMPVSMLANDAAQCLGLNGRINNGLVRVVCPSFASPSGLFLYVPKTLDLEQLYVSSRVRDLSRQASSAGTEIPIVRESEFSTRRLLLLDIPSDARFRSNLRIYAGPLTNGGRRFINTHEQTLRLDIYPSRSLTDPPLVSTELELSAAQVFDGSPYYVRPGYLSIADLAATFPQLASVPTYTIAITQGHPLTSPPVIYSMWAFVSTTNNETQEVTIVSP